MNVLYFQKEENVLNIVSRHSKPGAIIQIRFKTLFSAFIHSKSLNYYYGAMVIFRISKKET